MQGLQKAKPCNQKIGEKQREANSWFCGRGSVLRGGRSHLGPIRPSGRREALHPQLRRGRCRRHFALVARNEGKSMDFVDNCYLIKHSQGWFLWDTGITDAVAAMPNGLAPSDPKAIFWHRPKTLAAQLDQLGVKPSDIKALAVSHTHPDHIGNVEMFPTAMLYVQKAEYDWAGANGEPRFKLGHPVTKLEGDRDVFGD